MPKTRDRNYSVPYHSLPGSVALKIGRLSLKASVFALTISACFLLGQTQGQITGQIDGPDGKPLPGAVVSAHLVPSGTAKVKASAASAVTATSGSFSISNLAPGTYRICAQSPTVAALDPCQWSATPPTITVSSGQPAKLPTVTLAKGHPVQVHIDDPQQLLVTNAKKPGVHLLVGVWTPKGLFVAMPITSTQATGRDHQTFIPYDTPLTLSVHSKAFKMTDANGAPVDQQKGAAVPVQVPSSTAAAAAVSNLYHIVGVNP